MLQATQDIDFFSHRFVVVANPFSIVLVQFDLFDSDHSARDGQMRPNDSVRLS